MQKRTMMAVGHPSRRSRTYRGNPTHEAHRGDQAARALGDGLLSARDPGRADIRGKKRGRRERGTATGRGWKTLSLQLRSERCTSVHGGVVAFLAHLTDVDCPSTFQAPYRGACVLPRRAALHRIARYKERSGFETCGTAPNSAPHGSDRMTCCGAKDEAGVSVETCQK